MEVRYGWVKEFEKFKHVDAQKVGEELRAIGERNGGLIQAEVVVERARDKKSPMHGCFEWNDQRAAKKYRLIEARQMIKSVRVVVTKSDRSAHKQLAFVHSQAETGQRGYMDAAFAAANQAAREQVIREATAQIKAQERRLRLFNDLIDQAEALGGVVGELESMAG